MNLHERLRYAREEMKLTLKDVERQSEIGLSSLSEYENGHREPSFAQLGRLAKVYHRPTTFFLEEGEPVQQEMLWRHPLQSPQKEAVEATFRELCERYRNLEAWSEERVGASLPKFAGVRDVTELARRVRAALQLGDRPALTLLPILEETAGVKIFNLPLETGNAVSAWGEWGPAVLLNANDGPRERIFSLAHELYHLLTWGEPTNADQEKLADDFAVHLLVPAEALKTAGRTCLGRRRITSSDLEGLARQFGVPPGVVLRAFAGLCGHSVGDVNLPFKEEMDSPPSRPARFVDLAVKTYRNGDLALGRLAEYLGISKHEAKSKYFDEEDKVVAELS